MTSLPANDRTAPGQTDPPRHRGHEGHDGSRPLHAVLISGVAGAGRLVEPLSRALDGTGPAILPLDADLPAEKIRQLIDVFQPNTVIDGRRRSNGPFDIAWNFSPTRPSSSRPPDPPGSRRGLS